MTIGQRIARKRKDLDLSQEALGERLGVSRQSVYKWEADSALPEIDKLVAMSRLFGVTVGWLLGVEEPPADEGPADQAPEAGGGELTAAQLKMVEEIVDRYIAAQPKPEDPPKAEDPSPKKKRRWLLAAGLAGAVALVCVFGNLFSRLDRLQSQYNGLQSSVNSVQSTVNSQIGSIAGRVEEVLKSQNALTADYGTEILSADLSANTVTISAWATPRTYTEGMTALFQVDTGDGAVDYPAELGQGQKFAGTITCPLTDSISVSVAFLTGDKRETQVLYVYAYLYTNSIPAVEVNPNMILSFKELEDDGSLLWKDAYVYSDTASSVTGAVNANVGVAEIRDIRVGLFRNKELLAWLEPCGKPAGYDGFETCQFYRLAELSVTPEPGDVFCLAAVVTDECGREIVYEGLPRSMVRDGELRLAGDSDMTAAGIDLEDWWNGPWDYE